MKQTLYVISIVSFDIDENTIFEFNKELPFGSLCPITTPALLLEIFLGTNSFLNKPVATLLAQEVGAGSCVDLAAPLVDRKDVDDVDRDADVCRELVVYK